MSIGGNCYYFSRKKLPQAKASDSCHLLDEVAELASILTIDENNAVLGETQIKPVVLITSKIQLANRYLFTIGPK